MYRLLLRWRCRGLSGPERADMLRTYEDVIADARRRGRLALIRTRVAEHVDLLRAPGQAPGTLKPRPRRSFGIDVPLVPSWQDWRNAVRRAAAQPGYAAAVIGVLALGIALNTVVFSVADATMFRGLPYPNGPRIVEVFNEDTGSRFWFPGLSPTAVDEWRSHADVFEGLEGWNYGDFVLTGGAEPLDVGGAYVTPGVFAALGVRPAVGRLFNDQDAVPGRERVAIISDGLWRQFGRTADLGAIPLVLNDERHTVVAVMPPHFRFPAAHQQVWVPTPLRQPGDGSLQAIAVLAPGLSSDVAQARVDLLARGLNAARPRPAGWAIRLRPMRGLTQNASTTRALQVLSLSVIVVLLIACANVANLFFAQALGRSRELAVRAALGATRGRLVRELLAESLLLGIAGGLVGLGLATWGVTLATSLAPRQITMFSPNEIRINERILAFTAVLTIGTGILFGMLPAWRASRAKAGDALRARTGNAGVAQARTRGALVVVEVALSVLLLVGAALLARSFIRLSTEDPGFNPKGLVTVTLDIPTDRYPAGPRRRYLQAVQQAVSDVPGVRAVAVADGVPTAGGSIHFGRVEAEGSPAASGISVMPDATVSTGYFATLGIPILRGRAFGADEAPASAVISEGLAHRLWPGSDPIGRRFRVNERAPWRTVVGVAGEVHEDREMERETPVEMYSPMFPLAAPAPPPARPSPRAARQFVELMLVVRADRPLDLVPAIKQAVWRVDPSQPIQQVALVEHLLALSLTQDRFAVTLMATFALVALLLAAAGLYAVLAQIVLQRRQEIGIRLALGAHPGAVARLVASRGLVLTATGVAMGLALAWPASRALAAQLYGVQPHDPISFAAVPLALAGVAFVASWLPARRVLTVDPVTALRSE